MNLHKFLLNSVGEMINFTKKSNTLRVLCREEILNKKTCTCNLRENHNVIWMQMMFDMDTSHTTDNTS